MTNDNELPPRAPVKMTVIAIVIPTTTRKHQCQGMGTMALMGNRPAPRINSAENAHIARFHRGMSQVSQGL